MTVAVTQKGAEKKAADPVAEAVAAADGLMKEGKNDAALKILDRAIKRHKGQSALLRRRAQIHLGRRDGEKSRKDIEAALKAEKAPSIALFELAARIGIFTGDCEWAVNVCRQGVNTHRNAAPICYRLAQALSRLGNNERALAAAEVAVNLRPYYAEAQLLLAQILAKVGDTDRSERVYRYVIWYEPKNIQAHIGLATMLYEAGRLEDAAAAFEQAIKVEDRPFLHSNLGAVYRKLYRYEEAEQQYKIALSAEPGNSGFNYNRGNLLREVGRLDEAVASYRTALKTTPKDGSVHWNLSLALLADGQLKDGFAEYEWRWQHAGFPSKRRNFKQPQWDGSSFAGKTLLVHTEQGMGDVLQYARFLPAILERRGEGSRVVFECHKPLMAFMSQLKELDGIVERLGPDPLPDFDIHLPLMSAGYALGVEDFDSMPNRFPYLEPLPDRDFQIPELDPGKLNIGFVWGGNPNFQQDETRSTSLDRFLPLFDIPGTKWFSLQKGDREPELADAPPEIIRLSDRISDFADTAAAMAQLDLVISTCTSVVHLAGALDRPFWVLLNHSPDWRWLIERTDSPWYPSGRLFRQPEALDWDSVFSNVAEALQVATERGDRGEALVRPGKE